MAGLVPVPFENTVVEVLQKSMIGDGLHAEIEDEWRVTSSLFQSSQRDGWTAAHPQLVSHVEKPNVCLINLFQRCLINCVIQIYSNPNSNCLYSANTHCKWYS